MDFTLKILGTASALPISDRNPSAQVLQAPGRLFLIDCGEGTQRQMRQMHIPFGKLEAIFLSHIHGDHVFGIFGLLSTLSMYARSGDLPIYAPASFGPILRFFLSYYGSDISFSIVHKPLQMKAPEQIYEKGGVCVTAFPLNHGIDCFGFRFDEKLSPRQAGGRAPRSYAYCCDTAPFPELAQWAKGVDVMYHDCTYLKDLEDKAAKYYHSTTVQAAMDAREAGAGRLLIGHYSSRERDIEVYRKECAEIFPDTVASDDGMSIDI